MLNQQSYQKFDIFVELIHLIPQHIVDIYYYKVYYKIYNKVILLPTYYYYITIILLPQLGKVHIEQNLNEDLFS